MRKGAGRVPARVARQIVSYFETPILIANRIRFHILFPIRPDVGEYCNSKEINFSKSPPPGAATRRYLAIVRCGARHGLIDDGSARNFDIALNLYAKPDAECLSASEYVYSGGINKYRAAYQFIDETRLKQYARIHVFG